MYPSTCEYLNISIFNIYMPYIYNYLYMYLYALYLYIDVSTYNYLGVIIDNYEKNVRAGIELIFDGAHKMSEYVKKRK
jgi:hypothetical protein